MRSPLHLARLPMMCNTSACRFANSTKNQILQMLFIYTTTKIKFCSNQDIGDSKGRHKIDMVARFERFIRLARGAKLANVFNSTTSAPDWLRKTDMQVRRPASSFKDLTFFGSGQSSACFSSTDMSKAREDAQTKHVDEPNINTAPTTLVEGRVPYQQSLSLLFLNQGLKSDDLAKLRSNLRLLGLNVTHVPARF
jgi:hypothetical protein